ncbi:MAG: hypothetical protein BroJett003_03930 [Planctomycetota bacterium]|nr:MAG: hypothetical protein BroJett003_03930 [Planctomycetota bacterium]
MIPFPKHALRSSRSKSPNPRLVIITVLAALGPVGVKAAVRVIVARVSAILLYSDRSDQATWRDVPLRSAA